MHRSIFKIMMAMVLSSVALVSLPINAMDLDLTLNLEDESSALLDLTESDWVILKTTARSALNNSPDDSNHVWKNAETLNAGVITMLSTSNSDGKYCRDARFINTVGKLTSTTFVTLCKQGDKWKEESPRLTSTTTEESSNSSLSEMLNDEPLESTGITTKILGDTSEHCQQLSRNIENLEGKPLRRSAAIDLYQEECLR